MCHRKRWPRSSFLSQERPWPLTFRKISSILAKILYFSTFSSLFVKKNPCQSLLFSQYFLDWKKEKRTVWTRNFLAKSGDVFTKNALNCRRNDERKRIKIFALMKLKRKCWETKCFWEISASSKPVKRANLGILWEPKKK